MHAHVVNGVTVVHSHPYAPKKPNHAHSSIEFDLIHILNHFDTPASVLCFLALIFTPLFLVFLNTHPISKHFTIPYYGLVGLRAPPCRTFL